MRSINDHRPLWRLPSRENKHRRLDAFEPLVVFDDARGVAMGWLRWIRLAQGTPDI
jgi:hypothetical protein